MRPNSDPAGEKRRKARPLDAAKLDEIALAYVARFATSAAKLEQYLHRKLRERGWEGEKDADPADITRRLVSLGYVDDEAFARSRSGGLLRRGYGPRRVAQALQQAGIDEETRREVAWGDAEHRRAALVLARKRGFGPFGTERPDRTRREKQIAAMLRAGHRLDYAVALVDAPGVEAAEQWASEHDE